MSTSNRHAPLAQELSELLGLSIPPIGIGFVNEDETGLPTRVRTPCTMR
jgi:hypothetical protein